LSINELIKKIKSNNTEQFQNFSKLPYIRRDLSFIIDISTSYQSILNLIEKTNVLSLKKILLFDLYEGKNIPSGKKSLGMGFIFQDANKTLTHEEADQYIDIILKDLEEEFQIELRK
jgi:phenylalanyl-tRNA synthetase beta chain